LQQQSKRTGFGQCAFFLVRGARWVCANGHAGLRGEPGCIQRWNKFMWE